MTAEHRGRGIRIRWVIPTLVLMMAFGAGCDRSVEDVDEVRYEEGGPEQIVDWAENSRQPTETRQYAVHALIEDAQFDGARSVIDSLDGDDAQVEITTSAVRSAITMTFSTLAREFIESVENQERRTDVESAVVSEFEEMWEGDALEPWQVDEEENRDPGVQKQLRGRVVDAAYHLYDLFDDGDRERLDALLRDWLGEDLLARSRAGHVAITELVTRLALRNHSFDACEHDEQQCFELGLAYWSLAESLTLRPTDGYVPEESVIATNLLGTSCKNGHSASCLAFLVLFNPDIPVFQDDFVDEASDGVTFQDVEGIAIDEFENPEEYYTEYADKAEEECASGERKMQCLWAGQLYAEAIEAGAKIRSPEWSAEDDEAVGAQMVEMFDAACEAGHRHACYLTELYYRHKSPDGYAETQSPIQHREQVATFERLCNDDVHPMSCYWLARSWVPRTDDGIQPHHLDEDRSDHEKVETYLDRSCLLGATAGCRLLASLYDDGVADVQ